LSQKKAEAEKKIRLYKPDYLLCINTDLPFLPAGSRPLKIWQSGKADSTLKSTLIQLNRSAQGNKTLEKIALYRNCIQAFDFYAKKLCIIFENLAPRHVESGFVSSDTRMS
jgi:hypothetical protein